MMIRISMPVYLPGIRQESDAEMLRLGPMIYVWNIDHTKGSFSLSVNGKSVAHLLETFVSREDPYFFEICDKTMKVIAEVSTQSVLTTLEKTGLMPDILFAYHSENT